MRIPSQECKVEDARDLLADVCSRIQAMRPGDCTMIPCGFPRTKAAGQVASGGAAAASAGGEQSLGMNVVIFVVHRKVNPSEECHFAIINHGQGSEVRYLDANSVLYIQVFSI